MWGPEIILDLKRKMKYPLYISILPIITVWIYLFINHSISNIYLNPNSQIYLNVSRHLFSLPFNESEILNNINIFQVLPITPIFIYLIHFITFGNWEIASIIYIFCSALFSSFIFCKFLVVFNFNRNFSLFCLVLFSIYPLHHLISKSVINSDSLYLSFLFLSFISIRCHSYNCMFLILFFSVLTNEHGVILCISTSFYFFHRKNDWYKSLIIFFVLLSSFFVLGLFHFINFKKFFTFFYYKYWNSNQYYFFPFLSILMSSTKVDNLGEFHSQFIIFLFGIIGVIFSTKKLITYYCITELLYLSLIKYGDNFFHQAMYLEIVVIFGFESFFNHPPVKKILPFVMIVYSFVCMYLTCHIILVN